MKISDSGRDSWVGFAASPRARAGASRQTEQSTWILEGQVSDYLRLFMSAEGLSRWLAVVTKFDARLGAKLKFRLFDEDVIREEDELAFGGTYSSLVVPKNVVLITERHGEVAASIRSHPSGCEIKVSFSSSLLPDETVEWTRLVTAAASRLGQVAQETGVAG